MSAELPPPRRRATRRSASDRLEDALRQLGEHCGQIVAHEVSPWASITFAGTRHQIAILFAGEEAVAAGERFIAALPDHEFTLPGQLVADAAITEVDHRPLPSPRLAISCALLMLEDA